MSTPGTATAPVAVLVLVDAMSTLWAWSRLVLGPRMLRREPGLRFAKVLGSGWDGGFGLKPSPTRQGLLCFFDGEAAARRFLERSPTIAGYRRHAREFCSALLRPYTSRGSWDGMTLPLPPTAEAPPGPVAALTRGSIHPLRTPSFWRMAPAAQTAVEAAPGCRLRVGLGEAPLLRQATFSLWDSIADMDAYARQGAHLDAIRASRAHGHFTESMFVRFEPLALDGMWKGQALG